MHDFLVISHLPYLLECLEHGYSPDYTLVYICLNQTFLSFPDWSLEMQVLVVLLEVVGWPILLLAIVGMYNGKFFITN
jgi:hypothetical protein